MKDAPALTYVVGDVHGCLDLLQALEAKILEDAAEQAPDATPLIVFVGDLIDRGEQSAGVLDHVLEDTDGLHRIALLGNHEEMFLNFFMRPTGDARWLGFGGRETLLSYGMSDASRRGFDMPSRRLQQMLNAHLPDNHVDLLANSPISLRMPGYLITHAGLAAFKPLHEQEDSDLIWSRPEFLDEEPDCAARQGLAGAEVTLIHGHVPQDDILRLEHRINVDTGAYASGKLAALRLVPGEEPAAISVTLDHLVADNEV